MQGAVHYFRDDRIGLFLIEQHSVRDGVQRALEPVGENPSRPLVALCNTGEQEAIGRRPGQWRWAIWHGSHSVLKRRYQAPR